MSGVSKLISATLAANEEIAFELQKKKFFTKLKTSHEQLGVLQITWSLSVCEFKTSLRKFVKTGAIILSNFFDVLFYAFNHNYSLFTLLFKPLLVF
jgi:hypothetical protein